MTLELLYELIKYQNQYNKAIYRLLDNNTDIIEMILPLENLIHQLIENEIKYYIVEPHVSGKTYDDFKIGNTHKNNGLIIKDELKKYYEGIDECKKYFQQYKDSVIYFSDLLGNNSFMDSRYPIQNNQNIISEKKNVDCDELYSKWTDYCLASQKMLIIYVAYASSNSILYLKKNNKIQDEETESKEINAIVNATFEGFNEVEQGLITDEKEILFRLIKKFVERNKYYDEKYVC